MHAEHDVHLGSIAGVIHDFGHAGVVAVTSHPSSMTSAQAREALGLAIVDGRVKMAADISRRFAVGDWYDGSRRLRW